MADELGDDVVRLVTAPNPFQAHAWAQALGEAGIRSKVVGDYLEAGLGNISGMLPELWVHRADVSRAEEVLRQIPQAISEEDIEGGEPV
jgi:hypothetical protein